MLEQWILSGKALLNMLTRWTKKRDAQIFHSLNICKQDTDNYVYLCPSSSHYVIDKALKNDPNLVQKNFRRLYQSFPAYFWCMKVYWLRRKLVKLKDWQAELKCSELFWNICWQILEAFRAQKFSFVLFFMIHLVTFIWANCLSWLVC